MNTQNKTGTLAGTGRNKIGNKNQGKDTTKTRYYKSQAIKTLEQLAFQAKCFKYPGVRPELLLCHQYTDKTANGLTRCILDYLKLQGWQAERVSNTGRPVDRRQTFTDVLGNTRTIGRLTWIPGSGTNGTADISATIAGKSVKVEVKIGSDRQSQAQKDYQASIERAGGIYFVARDFESFLKWYTQNFCNGKTQIPKLPGHAPVRCF